MITNKQAINFSNARIRVAADYLASAYKMAKEIQVSWVAEGLDAQFPATTDVIDDGAENDGRTIITSQDVRNAKADLDDLITDFESAGMAKLLRWAKIAVNSRGF